MRNDKIKNQEDQQIIQEFMELRPVRAIDRMLSQNSVEKVFGLYQCLQQKIRKNTSDLRSTLTQKYENLVDCSNLLNNIQTFTTQIVNIEHNITRLLNQDPSQDDPSKKKNNNNAITLVQEQLYRKQYKTAMLLSYSIERQQSLEERQKLYLPFLRIQILENLDHELISTKITHKFITEIIACLTIYLEHLSSEERIQLIQNNKELEEGTILALLSQALKLKQQQEGGRLEEGDILEVVFKCKLFSLNRTEKDISEDQKINKFFYDICQLLNEKTRDNKEINRLAQIFCKNLKQIETHLSETFIISNQVQTISFRYQLYEHLLTSQNFIQVLEEIHSIIAKHYQEAPKVSLKENFLNLWNNYYRELLSLLFSKCDPTLQLPQAPIIDQEAPRQLLKYFITDSISTEGHLNSYNDQLEIFLSNLRELLQRTQNLSRTKISQQYIMNHIKAYYIERVQEINTHIEETCTKLSNQPSEFYLRSLILLFFMCDQFNSAIAKEKDTNQHIKELAQETFQWNLKSAQKFCDVFKSKNWSIRFDSFFMTYNPTALSPSKVEILREIILTIIENMLKESDPQRSINLISECRTKKDQNQKQAIDKKHRLADLPKSNVPSSTFAKKK